MNWVVVAALVESDVCPKNNKRLMAIEVITIRLIIANINSINRLRVFLRA